MGGGCPTCEGRLPDYGVDRRGFLRGTLWALGAALMGPEAFLRLAHARPEGEGAERVLVVLQLSGGNDGLATLVPWADDAYYRARRATAVAAEQVLRLDDYLGLHPNLKPLRALYDEGALAIIPGVGYPNPNRSHFASMDIWHAGSLEGARKGTGWIGRAADALYPDDEIPLLLTSIGKQAPLAMTGTRHRPVALEDPRTYGWRGDTRQERAFAELNDAEHLPPADAGDLGAKLHRVAELARASSRRIAAAAQAYRPRVDYPRHALAGALRLVASLVAGGLETRVYYVQQGGFDTHANQRNRHDRLMLVLAESVGAFLADLKAQGLGERVVLMAFSEFGRRVAENGSAGTDHGAAGPMFLMGGPVAGGVHGRHPSLTELDRGDLKMTTDFRSVYATLIEDWLGAPSRLVLGGSFPKLPLLRAPASARRAF